MTEESNLIRHLDREWDAKGWPKKGDDPQAWMYQNLRDLLSEFGSQGHSGSSAPYVLNLFKKLASFEPIGPLTGEPEEWVEVGDGTFQNRRCSHVFREGDGDAYDIDGKVFVEPNGASFTSSDSRVPVTFPYVPKTVYVQVESRQNNSNG